MQKNTQKKSTKTASNWSNNYYNSRYGNSSFWMDADTIASYDKGSTIDNVKLMSYQRAIGNFVRILTKKDNIKVNFQTKDRSYTDGKTVTISSKIDTGEFDTTVGLALHEASHVLLTDFNAMHKYLKTCNIPADKWGYFKNLVNIIEDRRIDYYVMTNAPGYYGYYDALYDTYFRSKEIDQALKTNVWCNETFQDYENHICNFANPNRNLDSLKFLRKIWNVIDLKNISRLKSTSDVIEVAREVYDIIQFAVEKSATKNPADVNEDVNKTPAQDINEKDIEKMLKDIENGADVNEDDDDNGSNGSMDVNAEGGDDTNDTNDGGAMDVNGTGNTSTTTLSPAQRGRLAKALAKQRSFTNGEIKKKGLSRKDADSINNLADQDIQLAEIELGNGYNKTKVDVVIIKGMTDAICKSDIVGSTFVKTNRCQYATSVEEGWSLGTILGKKLKTREEERSLKTTRLPAGRIDKRLIAELGFGNSKVFSQTLLTTTKESTLHLSLDASGSMFGAKWEAAIKTATAIAKAASMINSLRVIIDVRGSASGRDNRALVWVVYDSKKDPISVVRNKFGSLYPGGSTPEGLCFDALMKEIIGVSKGKDAYFINISDGEPAFAGYYGQTAIDHTRKQVKKMEDNNINVLAYFAHSSTNKSVENSFSYGNFKDMYGSKNSKCIDLNNFNELAKTLNSLFERNITNE